MSYPLFKPTAAASLPTTTKGDLIVNDGSVNTRLAVGVSNGQVLKVNSATATGLEWGAASANLQVRNAVTTDSPNATTDDYIYLSGASFTVTLPTAVGNTGKVFYFQHQGTSLTQVYTFNTTSAQTIGGVASGSYALYTNSEVLVITSDGTNWRILNHYAETAWSSPAAMTITATTSNPTKGTMTTDEILWRRVQQFAEIRIRYIATTGGAAGSGVYLYTLPGSLTMSSDQNVDTGTSNLSIGLALCDGQGFAQANTSSVSTLYPQAYSTTQIKFGGLIGGAINYVGSGGVGLHNTNVQLYSHFKVPIVGWQP